MAAAHEPDDVRVIIAHISACSARADLYRAVAGLAGSADALARRVQVAYRSRHASSWRGSRNTPNDILLSSTLLG